MVVILSPQAQIFNTVYSVCHGINENTFDYLPANDTVYPFIYVGEQMDIDRANKSTITGLVTQTIHVYNDYKRRGDTTQIMDSIKRELRKLRHTKNFYINVRKINSQTLLDTSTARTLTHGIVEVEFSFN